LRLVPRWCPGTGSCGRPAVPGRVEGAGVLVVAQQDDLRPPGAGGIPRRAPRWPGHRLVPGPPGPGP